MRWHTSRISKTTTRTLRSATTTAMSLSPRTPSVDCRRMISFVRPNSIGSKKLRHIADQSQSALCEAALHEGQLADGVQAGAAHPHGQRIPTREKTLHPVQGARGQ